MLNLISFGHPFIGLTEIGHVPMQAQYHCQVELVNNVLVSKLKVRIWMTDVFICSLSAFKVRLSLITQHAARGGLCSLSSSCFCDIWTWIGYYYLPQCRLVSGEEQSRKVDHACPYQHKKPDDLGLNGSLICESAAYLGLAFHSRYLLMCVRANRRHNVMKWLGMRGIKNHNA